MKHPVPLSLLIDKKQKSFFNFYKTTYNVIMILHLVSNILVMHVALEAQSLDCIRLTCIPSFIDFFNNCVSPPNKDVNLKTKF